MITTYSGARSPEELVKEEQEKLAWMEWLVPQLHKLDPIEDIVGLSALWDYPWGTLCLRYKGPASSAEEARGDIARIMDALGVTSLEKHVAGGGEYQPHLSLTGAIALDGRRVKLHLEVSWLPDGCRVQVEQRQTRSSHTQYSVSCGKQA
jgi:hypothetical protein